MWALRDTNQKQMKGVHLCYLCIVYCSEAAREGRAGNKQAAKNQCQKVGGMSWVQVCTLAYTQTDSIFSASSFNDDEEEAPSDPILANVRVASGQWELNS